MRSTHIKKLAPVALLVAGLGVMALYFSFDPSHYPFPKCPLLLLTGLYCPGCGSQRALHALLHGQVVRAAGFNVLAVACVPILAIGAADGALGWFRGRPQRATLLYQPWLGWLITGLTVGFALLRNLPGPVGTWLAPGP